MQSLESIAPLGLEWREIPFIIVISPEGEFVDFIDTRDDKENKAGRKFLVAKNKGRQGSASHSISQILWDHSGYVLEIPTEDGENKAVLAPKQHISFLKELQTLRELFPHNEEFLAVERFYEKKQHLALSEENIKTIQKKQGGNISFLLSTEPNQSRLIACHPDIKKYIDLKSSEEEENSSFGCCLVTGKHEAIARLHDGYKLNKESNTQLISFNAKSYNSYGKQQGFNAPISTKAAKAIAAALSNLLTFGKETNYKLGETTFVFWGTEQSAELYELYKKATFTGISTNTNTTLNSDKIQETRSTKRKRGDKNTTQVPQEPNPEEESRKVLAALKSIRGSKGGYIDKRSLERFYILGLTTNKSRMCVKLWTEGTVGEIVGNTLQHLDDMNIISFGGTVEAENPPLRKLDDITLAITKKGISDKFIDLLTEELVDSIVKGLPYPAVVQKLCLNRVRRDHKVPDKTKELRVAILKAYINRKNRYYKKDIVMQLGLDREQTNIGYLAGRLFALYEYTQRRALGELNSTVSDRFFSKASLTPNVVFPKAERLYMKHIKKLKGKRYYVAKAILREYDSICMLFSGSETNFPSRFSLDEQSMFVIGFHHESVYLRTPTKERGDKENEFTEEVKESFDHNEIMESDLDI